MKDNQTSQKRVCGREVDHEIKDSLDAGCKTHYVDQTSECPNADEHNNPAFPSTCSLCEETKTSEGKNKCYIFVKRFNDGINVKISTKEFQQEAFVTNQMLDFSIDETAMLDFSAFNSMVISQAKEEEQDKRVCIICGEKVVDCHGHILKNESQPKDNQKETFVGGSFDKPQDNQCTCNFSKDTAREIGHYKGCPCYGEKTWWQDNQTSEWEERFDEFMVKEYGKWKIGRVEAKRFISQVRKETIENALSVFPELFAEFSNTPIKERGTGYKWMLRVKQSLQDKLNKE